MSDCFSVTFCCDGDKCQTKLATKLELCGVRMIVKDDLATLCTDAGADDDWPIMPSHEDPFSVTIWDANGFRQTYLVNRVLLHGSGKCRRSITWDDLQYLSVTGPKALRDVLTAAKASES